MAEPVYAVILREDESYITKLSLPRWLDQYVGQEHPDTPEVKEACEPFEGQRVLILRMRWDSTLVLTVDGYIISVPTRRLRITAGISSAEDMNILALWDVEDCTFNAPRQPPKGAL